MTVVFPIVAGAIAIGCVAAMGRSLLLISRRLRPWTPVGLDEIPTGDDADLVLVGTARIGQALIGTERTRLIVTRDRFVVASTSGDGWSSMLDGFGPHHPCVYVARFDQIERVRVRRGILRPRVDVVASGGRRPSRISFIAAHATRAGLTEQLAQLGLDVD